MYYIVHCSHIRWLFINFHWPHVFLLSYSIQSYICRISCIVSYGCALQFKGYKNRLFIQVRFSSNSDIASNKRALILSFRLPVGRTDVTKFLFTKILSKIIGGGVDFMYEVITYRLCFSVTEEENKVNLFPLVFWWIDAILSFFFIFFFFFYFWLLQLIDVFLCEFAS